MLHYNLYERKKSAKASALLAHGVRRMRDLFTVKTKEQDNLRRILSLILVLSFILPFAGCGNNSADTPTPAPESTESEYVEADNTLATDVATPQPELIPSSEPAADQPAAEETEEPVATIDPAAQAQAEAEERARAEEEARRQAEEERIRAEQLNSFAMMYYLAITAEEIRTSHDNRLILDDRMEMKWVDES